MFGFDFENKTLLPDLGEMEEKVRHVRSPEGSKRYGLPIGAPILSGMRPGDVAGNRRLLNIHYGGVAEKIPFEGPQPSERRVTNGPRNLTRAHKEFLGESWTPKLKRQFNAMVANGHSRTSIKTMLRQNGMGMDQVKFLIGQMSFEEASASYEKRRIRQTRRSEAEAKPKKATAPAPKPAKKPSSTSYRPDRNEYDLVTLQGIMINNPESISSWSDANFEKVSRDALITGDWAQGARLKYVQAVRAEGRRREGRRRPKA